MRRKVLFIVIVSFKPMYLLQPSNVTHIIHVRMNVNDLIQTENVKKKKKSEVMELDGYFNKALKD